MNGLKLKVSVQRELILDLYVRYDHPFVYIFQEIGDSSGHILCQILHINETGRLNGLPIVVDIMEMLNHLRVLRMALESALND